MVQHVKTLAMQPLNSHGKNKADVWYTPAIPALPGEVEGESGQGTSQLAWSDTIRDPPQNQMKREIRPLELSSEHHTHAHCGMCVPPPTHTRVHKNKVYERIGKFYTTF